MELVTKYHGTFSYRQEDIIIFSNGLMGLEELKKFILVEIEENPLFKILHSIEDSEVGLVVVSPFDIKEDYEIDINDDILQTLSIEKAEDVTLYNTVTLNSDIDKITVNLKAPIVINKERNIGEQVIIDKEEYKIKHPLMER
jgi:Uncharacterized protein conserved in bacteria